MKVILLEDVKSLGKKGELVNVSDGHARNYIIPRKLVIGLLGSNGAGKTTLMRAIAGSIPVDSGEISFSGERRTQVFQIIGTPFFFCFIRRKEVQNYDEQNFSRIRFTRFLRSGYERASSKSSL